MNLKRIANSLVTRLLVMALALLAMGTAVSWYQLTRFLRSDLTAIVANQQTTLAGYVARDIDESLSQRLQTLQRLAIGMPPDLLSRPAELRQWLAERQSLQPYFSLGLAVVDRHGRVRAHDARLAALAERTLADEADFQAASGGAATVGLPRLSPLSKRPLLPMAVPVHDAAGGVLAVLLGVEEISPNGFLARLLEGHGAQPGGLLLVSPRDRLFVASTRPEMLMAATPPPGVNLLHDRAMAGYRGSGTTINAQGIEEISAIASVPTTGWFVVARLPSAQALAPVARLQSFIVSRRLPVVALVLLLIVGTFAWLLRPLFSAATLAERMSRGETPLAPLPVVRDDEVGHLTAAFNRLLATLGGKQAELERLAHHDNLTGLPNRKLLLDRLQQALARARRDGTQVAVLFLDLDGFKQLNDTLGHEAGDTALRAVARRLVDVVRQTDTVARLGGDEFVLLAPDFHGAAADELQALAAKCLEAVAQPLDLGGTEHRLGVSVGVALSGGEHSPEDLLVVADKAMYRAKPQRTVPAPRATAERAATP